jgi:hypothetical protein
VPFAEKSRFSLWVGLENWFYFPEKSANPEKFFTFRLFDDGSENVPQKICLNRKIVADF